MATIPQGTPSAKTASHRSDGTEPRSAQKRGTCRKRTGSGKKARARSDMFSKVRLYPVPRLMAARTAAGFASARAAAEAHRWPVSTYSFDETEQRKRVAKRIALYAKAFGVPEAWLHYALPAEDTSGPAMRARSLEGLYYDELRTQFLPRTAEVRATHGASKRLMKARKDAGFSSARAAAVYFGWVIPTVHSHENGQGRFGRPAAQKYGLAYGADPSWLLTGSAGPLPAGRSPTQWPTGGPRGSKDEVAALDADPFASGTAPSSPPAHDEATGPAAAGKRQIVVTATEVPAGCRILEGDRLFVDPHGAGPGWYARASGIGGARVFSRRDDAPLPDDTLGRIECLIVDPSWSEG